jgi:hypothetical protein
MDRGELRGLAGFGASHFGRTLTWVAADLYAFFALTTVAGLSAPAAGAAFCATMVLSDQPGGEVVHRLASKALWPEDRDVFATALLDETRLALGSIVDQTYRSRAGHVVIRVNAGGATYQVYVLDDRDEALPAVSESRRGGAKRSRNRFHSFRWSAPKRW